jgi:cell division protein FtsI (penicillin-binding protein 3)
MREDAARELLSIMESVVEPGGTGTLAAIPGVRVAGKTGTAEKVDPVTGRYSKELHLSSFLGVAPADDPQVVAVVMVDEPHGVVFGGQTAGPAWRAIVERALVKDGAAGAAALDTVFLDVKKQKASTPALVEVTDAKAREPAPGTMPELRGASARHALRALAALDVEVVITGHGRVVGQTPPAGEPIAGPVQLTLEVLQ